MKICCYDDGLPGLIEGDSVYPLRDALAGARKAKPLALASVRLRAPIDNPPAIWAAAANYRAHQAEMKERVGSDYERAQLSGFDTFCGLGPWIVTAEAIREPQDVRIDVEQNGRPVMQAHTADMINGLRDLIRFLSGVTTLKPGTHITTGTPAGVSKLADGDHLKGTIDGIGTMELRVGAEP